MSGPVAVQPRQLQDLIAEVRVLHERLHRVAIALALSEELLAITLEQLSTTSDKDSARYKLQANRARIASEECRIVAKRLDELNPDGGTAIDLTAKSERPALP